MKHSEGGQGMDYKKTAHEILSAIGGKDNLASAAHCATRLRLVIADNTKIRKSVLENIKPSADMLLSSGQIEEKWFDDAYALHFCSVSLGDFPMKDAHIRAIKTAREKGMLISFDPNLRFPLWKDKGKLYRRVNEFLPMCDILKISDEEVGFITGGNDMKKAVPKLLEQGVKLIVYTCGRNGAYAYTRNAEVYSDSIRVNAVDTTGAGDGFIGSFLWKLQSSGIDVRNIGTIDEGTLKECLDFSNRFCAISVQSEGAIASYPTINQL